MASIAIMVGGAVLNATAFIGGNYLARALGGGDKAALEEKKRHDKALEDYQAAYARYTHDRTHLLDWIATNAQEKEQAKQNFTNTDYAFKLYNKAHPDEQMVPPRSPSSQISTSQASSRKRMSSRSWAPALSLWATRPSGSFKLFYALLIWTPNSQRFTTDPGATGSGSGGSGARDNREQDTQGTRRAA